MKRIILASSSPSRLNLLKKLEIPFEAHSPDVDETPLANETAPELVHRLSELKARAIAEQYPNSLIIGSDSVASHHGQIQGKPLTHANAYTLLKSCSGQVVEFYTGLCLLNTATNHTQHHTSIYEVKYRQLTDHMIEYYLNKERPYFCAGGVKAETLGLALFEYMRGDDFYALLGLPLLKLVEMLAAEGIEILSLPV
ncbi:MAG: Maf family nucleotide pyrophosphatase [Gammaproteobacteria bacterium]|nr:Maf family nucleotide pyrophosphatase [Gammaproteobacteria bacterium]